MPQEKRYTLADALTWDESERIEPVYGGPVMMAPPVRRHQEIIGLLTRLTSKLVQVFVLDGKYYAAKDFGTAKDTIKVNVLEDCAIDLSQVFLE